MVKTLALFGAIALLPLAAHAADDKEKWEHKAVADKPQVVLNPAKAYIVVQADYVVVPQFMKRPNADEAAKHAANRAEELAKEREKWAKKHAAWEKDMATLAKAPSSVKRPTEPQEPTEANFSWPRYEQVHAVYLGPQNRFAKGEGGRSTYLHEVEPGEYVFYGNAMAGGVGGICACLGTVAFKAEAGKVTSLGQFRMPWVDGLRGPKEQRAKTSLDLPEGVTTMAFAPAAFSDPRIPADIVVPARFTPVDRMPNWFGLEVDRVMPIDGVMRYDRDKVVDLTVPAPVVPAAR